MGKKQHIGRTLFVQVYLLFVLSFPLLAEGELKEKLQALASVHQVEQLETTVYPEKYLLRFTQQLDHSTPEAGVFTQRVVVCHKGIDRPTILVTEGYGGAYAQHPDYKDELSELFDANVVFVEHRYFLESTPEPLDWKYLTAENSAYDLHHITTTMKQLYPGKWISTGISKGGQTTTLYRAYFPGDVDISVPYVAPLNRALEDPRHLSFLRKTGSRAERKTIAKFQHEILKRKSEIIPLLAEYSEQHSYTYRIPLEEVLDYCVLEYPFALWQWGTSINTIPSLKDSTKVLFDHLMSISSPDYFSEQQPYGSFFVQAARELGYYPYDTKPFRKKLSITSADGYLHKLMLPDSAGEIEYSDALYRKVYQFLQDNDPKMIFIYGENDPWSATRVPDFKNKKNLQIYIEPGGSHRARIRTMPEATQKKIIEQISSWLQ
ncbi:MAG: aminopeptidase [Tannerellaceae bacterium]|nr:aminopeptidase [Tannerellaceae bacterium]